VEHSQNQIVLVGRPREDGSSGDQAYSLLPGLKVDSQPGENVRLQLSADESQVIRVESDERREK